MDEDGMYDSNGSEATGIGSIHGHWIECELKLGKVFSTTLLHHADDENEARPESSPEKKTWLERLEAKRDAYQHIEEVVSRMQSGYDDDPDGGWILDLVWVDPAISISDWELYANDKRVAVGSVEYLIEELALPAGSLEETLRNVVEKSRVKKLPQDDLLAAKAGRERV